MPDEALEPVLDRDARRATWSSLRWTLRLTHPREDVQAVLRNGGQVMIVEYGKSIDVIGVASNLNINVLCPRLICPQCKKQCQVLWLNDDHRRAGCRKCSNIKYSSTSRQPSDLFVYAKMKLLKMYEEQPERFTDEDEALLEQCRMEVSEYLR